MINAKSKYYFTKLTSTEQEIYKLILIEWGALKKKVTFELPSNVSLDVSKIVKYLSMDNPGLFFIDFNKIQLSRYRNDFTLEAKFHYKKKQITEYESRLRQEIRKIMASYSVLESSEYEKVVALHDCLAKNIKYEYGSHSETSHSVLGGLLKRKTVCEGFAKAFKLLCDEAKVNCIVVSGKATPAGKASENHAWNIVKLGGNCYHVDVTWDSCAYEKTEQVSHSHLNITDSDAAQDHQWDRNLLPQCDMNTFNYYIVNKSHFETDEEFKAYFVQGLKNGKKSFEVRFGAKPKNQDDLFSMIQKIMQTRLTSLFLGYSCQIQYNSNRGTINIQVEQKQ